MAEHRAQAWLFTMSSEGQFVVAAGLEVTDDVFGGASLPMGQLKHLGVAGLVGDERGVAPSFDVVEQRQLGAGVGSFPSHDQPGPLGPGPEVDEVGEVSHFGPVAGLTVGLDSGNPPALGPAGGGLVESHRGLDGQTDPVIDGEPETEPAVPIGCLFSQPVGRPAAVSPNHDLTGHRLGVIVPAMPGPLRRRERVDGGGQHLDVIGRGVRPGVTRADHLGQDLSAFGVHRHQRVEPERTLPGASSVLFVGSTRHDRGVDIDHDPGPGRLQTPTPSPSPGHPRPPGLGARPDRSG